MTQAIKDTFQEDLSHIIHKFGFPTFDEFRKNPDKYRRKKDELLECADGSSITDRKRIKQTTYMWKDSIKLTSLEQVERVAKEEGFTLHDLEMSPHMLERDGTSKLGAIEQVIQFWPKADLKQKGLVIANG